MFSWVGSKFDSILSGYVLGVVSKLMAGLAPLALTIFTLWVALYGWAVLRNEVQESVPNFLWKTFKIGLVLAFALQSSFYISNVSDAANALATGVATTFVPDGIDATTISSPYGLLDKFSDDANAQVSDIMKEATLLRLDLVLAAAIFSVGTVLFLCVGLFVVTLAKVLLTFVIAVGPLFVLSLAWRPTARFFDSWLSMLLNAVVMTWFVFFALGLSTYIGAAIFKAILDGGGFLGPSFNVLGEATRYCVLMTFMAIVCFQAPSLASALTGGAAVQQGIQMIQNTMIASGFRSSRGGSGGSAAAPGGVVRAGAGIPRAAGYAVGRAAAATGRYAGAAARLAAYQLAALRGRR
jgi:type IV secretion system protein VirB6